MLPAARAVGRHIVKEFKDRREVSADSTGASGLAGRYATALYDLAEADKALDDVAGDLRRLAAMIAESGDLRRLLRSPTLSRADQGKALNAVAERAGFSDLTRRFLGVVAAKRRLFVLGAMIDAYLAQLAARRGELVAEVASARPLSEAQLSGIGDSLRQALGSKVTVNARVDAGLLGGLVVKIGSRMVDASLRTKIQKLQIAMKGIG